MLVPWSQMTLLYKYESQNKLLKKEWDEMNNLKVFEYMAHLTKLQIHSKT